MIRRLIPSLAALALVVAARRSGAGAIQADASRSSSSCMAGPAPATTCSRARSPPSSTRRSSRRCASRSSTSRAAAATTAAAYVVSKKGDPHVIACFTNIWLIDPLVQQAATNRLHDMSPIARLVVEPALVVVLADSPYKSLGQFIEAAKAKPGQAAAGPAARSPRARTRCASC